jgi:hypothetical protein
VGAWEVVGVAASPAGLLEQPDAASSASQRIQDLQLDTSDIVTRAAYRPLAVYAAEKRLCYQTLGGCIPSHRLMLNAPGSLMTLFSSTTSSDIHAQGSIWDGADQPNGSM